MCYYADVTVNISVGTENSVNRRKRRYDVYVEK